MIIDITPLRRSREFRLLWIGQSVSDIGSRITMVALPFQVFSLTRSSLAVGLLALCELVPLLTLSVIGGAIADAVDRRRLLLWTHLAMAGASLILAVNALGSFRHLWVLYAVGALTAGLYAVYSPGLRSLVPRLVDPELLVPAIALTTAYGSFGFLLGPILGGALIAALGLTWTYLIDVATFGVALGTLAAMAAAPPAEGADRFGLNSIREGLRFVRRRPVLQSTFTVDLNAMIFGMPEALFPAVAERLGGGPQVLGLLFAAPHAGSFLVNLFSGRSKHVRRQGLAVMTAVVVWGGALVVFGLSPGLWLALPALALAGGADMWSGIFRTTILQTVVPDALRGRLSGIELAVVASGPALGNLEAGVVATLVSVPFAIVSGGVACILGVGVLGVLVPQFARYDARHPTP